MSRVLITTAIEETWPEGEPVLFLGEWCRRFSRRERWSGLDAEVVDYHWDNRERLSDDFRYLKDLHERLLTDLARTLNALHGTNHSLRYWRILVGPWLGNFVGVLRDRWLSVEEAVERHDISWTYVLNLREPDLVPGTYSDFEGLYVRDDWNHHIYTIVLERFTQVELRLLPQPSIKVPVNTTIHSKKAIKVKTRETVIKVKTRIWELLSRLLARLTREDDIVIRGSYLSFRNEVALHLRLRQLPLIWHLVPHPHIELGASELRWTMPETPVDPFEQLVKEMIPRQIPRAYIGGYDSLQVAVQETQFPTNPRLIFSSGGEFNDDLFKAWTASKVELGTRLVVGQHGGGYGAYRQGFFEDHQRKVSDMYLSWGWEDPVDERVKPVGQLIDRRPSREVSAKKDKDLAVLVGYTTPRQSYFLYSHPISSQWLCWLEDQFKFVEALPDYLRSTLLVRLYGTDFGWDQVERWQDRYPNIALDNAQESKTLIDLLPQARVLISTYNATTYLETLAMDVPTIMFWNPNHWELRETVIPLFGDLAEVGILHDSPTSAAAKLVEVWDDVDSWWSSERVTTARRRFCDGYSQSPHNLVERTVEALRATMKAPPRLT